MNLKQPAALGIPCIAITLCLSSCYLSNPLRTLALERERAIKKAGYFDIRIKEGDREIGTWRYTSDGAKFYPSHVYENREQGAAPQPPDPLWGYEFNHD
jgi:hypothetical protein